MNTISANGLTHEFKRPLCVCVPGRVVRSAAQASKRGNGVLFPPGAIHSNLLAALRRALWLYSSAEDYAALRSNARVACVDVDDTAWQWRCELARLRACVRHGAP